jgi:hypothetical protein
MIADPNGVDIDAAAAWLSANFAAGIPDGRDAMQGMV